MQARWIVLALLLALLLAACTAGVNPAVGTPAEEGDSAGFLLGLWQGFIAPFTFLISLFTDEVSVYEVHNTGNWYDFGFVIGAGILFGGSRARRRRKR